MLNPYEYALPVEELISRYKAVYSGAVYDVLEHLGYPHQALANDVKPIDNKWVLAGPAFTIKGIPDSTGNETLRARRIELFSAMKATGVPLIDVRDCSFDEQVAHYGEMNATVGASCGVIGAVVDGGSRDTRFLLERNFPLFCRYLSPVEALRRWSYYDWQTTISLRGAITATVSVSPGDFIFGDLDGVVIIPRAVVVEVLVGAESLIAEEDLTRLEFESGADPVEVYQRHGRL